MSWIFCGVFRLSGLCARKDSCNRTAYCNDERTNENDTPEFAAKLGTSLLSGSRTFFIGFRDGGSVNL